MEGAQNSPNQEAARWYARLRAPDCTSEERAQFDAWLASDPRNAAAYTAAERLNDSLAALAMTDARLKAMVDEAASAGASLPDDDTCDDEPSNKRKPLTITAGALRPRRISRPFAWAAVLALTALSAPMLLTIGAFAPQRDENDVLSGDGRPALQYRSGTSRRAVMLEDGTRVSLDVASVIEVHLDDSRRAVTLLQGRALFDATYDASRPFVVTVGGEQVTSLGTRFQVDRAPSEVVVTLAEGAVTVGRKSGGPAVQLFPGEQLSSSAGSTRWQKRRVNARTVTSWSLGDNLIYAKPQRADAFDNG